jgi:hypothetical protein
MENRDQEAVDYLREAVENGEEWYPALLEAIRRWGSADEDRDGRKRRYLIAGEAFDWLKLAARLLEEIRGQVVEDETADLLFRGRPPIDLGTAEFKRRIGSSKYRAYLNYLYGVMVEQFLVLAVLDEVRKARLAQGMTDDAGVEDTAYRRIYGLEMADLLRVFRKEKGYPRTRSITLDELDEFAYWRFKYRLARAEQARLASDTRKALLRMQRQAHQFAQLIKNTGGGTRGS